jgi:endonuclease/exonuclease/phosphatase family metal-dependent hydrolase
MLLRVATFNVWGIPPPIGKQVQWRMGRIGERLGSLDLDVIAFQEVWMDQSRRRLVRGARRAGFDHIWFNPDEPGAGGLVVASRFPIEAADFKQYALPWAATRPRQLNYFAGRGFVDLRVHTPAGPVRLLNTHLHSQSTTYRVAQVIELAERIAEVDEPLFALGDFNFRDRFPEYTIWRGLTGMRDAATEAGNPEPTAFPGNPLRPRPAPKRIDYVFVRGDSRSALRCVRCRRVFDEFIERDGRPSAYSDHAGVLAEVRVEERRGSPAWLPDPEAARLASEYLARGRARAEARHSQDRLAAGFGWTGALLAAAGARVPRLSRRRLLHGAVQAAGIAALVPATAGILFAEHYAPGELRAYDGMLTRLDRILRGAHRQDELLST